MNVQLTDRPVIEWTPEKLERFRKLIHSQTRLDTTVIFEGHEYLVGYGKVSHRISRYEI